MFLNIECHRLFLRRTRFLQCTWSSGSRHVSFELSPVHSFTSSNHSLCCLPRDLSPSNLPCQMVFVRVPFAFTTCPNHERHHTSQRLAQCTLWFRHWLIMLKVIHWIHFRVVALNSVSRQVTWHGHHMEVTNGWILQC